MVGTGKDEKNPGHGNIHLFLEGCKYWAQPVYPAKQRQKQTNMTL